MMKKLLFTLTLLLLCFVAKSQDLIVTMDNDSINAKITSLKNEQIAYVYLDKGKLKWQRKKFTKLKGFVSNYYDHADIVADKVLSFNSYYSKYRLGVNAGYSSQYHIIILDEWESKDFLKDLKRGYNLNIDASYFFDPSLGVGLEYGFSKFSATWDLESLNINDAAYHIIPKITGRTYNKNKINAAFYSFGLGYVKHKRKIIYPSSEALYTCSSPVLMIAMGYDFGLSRSFAIGIQADFIAGLSNSPYRLKKYIGNDANNVLSLDSRYVKHLFNLSIGIRYLK